jgi:hypothetical protein
MDCAIPWPAALAETHLLQDACVAPSSAPRQRIFRWYPLLPERAPFGLAKRVLLGPEATVAAQQARP